MGIEQNKDIPLPIVKLNRWILVIGVLSGLLLRQPLLTTALFAVMLSAALFGRRGSPIFWVGKRLLAKRNAAARREGRVEDPQLVRFNNTIAAVLLGGAQLAFLFDLEVVGWALSLAVAIAAGVALAGSYVCGGLIYSSLRQVRFQN